jgi:hypothetical protein
MATRVNHYLKDLEGSFRGRGSYVTSQDEDIARLTQFSSILVTIVQLLMLKVYLFQLNRGVFDLKLMSDDLAQLLQDLMVIWMPTQDCMTAHGMQP